MRTPATLPVPSKSAQASPPRNTGNRPPRPPKTSRRRHCEPGVYPAAGAGGGRRSHAGLWGLPEAGNGFGQAGAGAALRREPAGGLPHHAGGSGLWKPAGRADRRPGEGGRVQQGRAGGGDERHPADPVRRHRLCPCLAESAGRIHACPSTPARRSHAWPSCRG